MLQKDLSRVQQLCQILLALLGLEEVSCKIEIEIKLKKEKKKPIS